MWDVWFVDCTLPRQAAAEGREWTPDAAPAAAAAVPAAAPAPSYSAPAPAGGDVDDVMARVNAMMRGETPPAPAPAAAAPAAAPSYAAPAAGREDAAAIMARVNQQSGGSPPPAPTSTWRWSGQDLGGYNPRARGGRPAAAGATPGLERPVAVSNEDPAAVLARAMAMMN